MKITNKMERSLKILVLLAMSVFSQNIFASKKLASIYVHPVNIIHADNGDTNMNDLQLKLTEVIHESMQVYLSVSSIHHKEIVENIRENKIKDFFSCGDLECLTPYIINFDLNSILIHKIQCGQNSDVCDVSLYWFDYQQIHFESHYPSKVTFAYNELSEAIKKLVYEFLDKLSVPVSEKETIVKDSDSESISMEYELQSEVNQAFVMASLGYYKRSIEHFEKAVSLDSENISLLFDYAKIAQQNDNLILAISLYEKILSKEPANFEALEYISALYIKKGDYLKAVSLFKNTQNPSANLYLTAGIAYYHLSQFSNAEIILQKGIAAASLSQASLLGTLYYYLVEVQEKSQKDTSESAIKLKSLNDTLYTLYEKKHRSRYLPSLRVESMIQLDSNVPLFPDAIVNNSFSDTSTDTYGFRNVWNFQINENFSLPLSLAVDLNAGLYFNLHINNRDYLKKYDISAPYSGLELSMIKKKYQIGILSDYQYIYTGFFENVFSKKIDAEIFYGILVNNAWIHWRYTLSHQEFPLEKLGKLSQKSVVIASENPDDIRDALSHYFSTTVSWKTKNYHAFTQLGALQNNAHGNNYIFRGLDYNISVQHVIIPKLNGLMYLGLQYKDFYRFVPDIYYQRKEIFFLIGLQFRYILSHHTQLKAAYQNVQNLHIKENSKIPSAYEYSQQLISTSIIYEY